MRPAPVFLLAPARSLSTVVVAMLGSHPELYGFPELTLFEHDTVGERLDAPRHPTPQRNPPPWNPVAGLERALAELHDGGQDDETIARARAWLGERRDWTGRQVLDHLLERVAPRIGVEKSPGTSKREENLQRLADAYPAARVIHLVRHPATTSASLRRTYRLTGREWACVRQWIAYHRRIAAFCAALPPGRTRRVRGEDVLNDGGRTLAALAAWLGVRNDTGAVAAMLAPQESPYARQPAYGGGDGVFLGDPVPHRVEITPSLDLPADWNVPAEMRTEAAELAVELGY